MVTLPIEMPKYCFECPCCDKESGRCEITNNWNCDANGRPGDCPLTEAKISHWKIEYVKEENRTYALCMNCKTGICFEGKYTNNLPVSAKYCPNCGVEMRCVVRTIEPKESEAANGETVR